MKRLSWGNVWTRGWKATLGLALGLAASRAAAEEVEWHAAPAPPPAVSILAPVPLPASPARPPASPDGFRPVSFSADTDAGSRVIFRAQMSDAPKAMPVGLPDGPNDPPAKKAAAGPPATEVLPPPTAILPGGDACGCAAGNPDGCGAFGVNDCCAPPTHCFWITTEGLVWWLKGQHVPPLVTAGLPIAALPGALGQPGTVVLFGGKMEGDDARGGARIHAGWWFDEEHTLGVDGGFFGLGQQSARFSAASLGTPALFRPFLNPGFAFNPATGTFVAIPPTQDAEAVAFPGALAGAVNVRLTSQFWGYDANLRTNLFNGCFPCLPGSGWTVDGYAGFRGLGLDENLLVSERLVSLVPGAPGLIALQDQFQTRNRFSGGQLGLDTELRWGDWFLSLGSRVALGDVHQSVTISGGTATTDAMGGIMFSSGGLLTQSSNIGHYTRDRFGVMSEGTINVGYQVTSWFRVFAGYNIIYLSTVVRPAAQINPAVNPTLIPLNGTTPVGPALPSFTFRSTDFFAQGLNLGLEFRW